MRVSTSSYSKLKNRHPVSTVEEENETTRFRCSKLVAGAVRGHPKTSWRMLGGCLVVAGESDAQCLLMLNTSGGPPLNQHTPKGLNN